ncbi:hypothetical protein [Paraclostridium dentum]|uniref:hypothetical protein n=1 Tax=Paraclostridium dentum TaxID=2662455 RepID=UPI00147545E5|nr:hypothetical protein [Paraclostridium dentum]
MASINETSIFDVVFKLDEAQISDETPEVLSQVSATNDSDQEAAQSINVSYTDDKTYTFNGGSTTEGAAKTTISADLPFITGVGNITVHSHITKEPFEWGTAKTITTSLAVTANVTVPPKSTMVVKYSATKGTCKIPYSYTREDRMSDGQVVTSQHTDGVYNGVSRYNFTLIKDVSPL